MVRFSVKVMGLVVVRVKRNQNGTVTLCPKSLPASTQSEAGNSRSSQLGGPNCGSFSPVLMDGSVCLLRRGSDTEHLSLSTGAVDSR